MGDRCHGPHVARGLLIKSTLNKHLFNKQATRQLGLAVHSLQKVHQVLERSREAGHPVPSDEILAHIAPIAFRHINFRGIYRFPLERYLDRLLPSVLPRKIAAGAK